MAKSARISPEQIEKAQKLLQDLPEKDERKTRDEAAGLLEKDFRKALRKGYTPKELSAMLKNAGVIIPAYLVQKYLMPENENLRPKPAPKPVPKPAPEKQAKKTPDAGEFIVTPDTPLEDSRVQLQSATPAV